MIFFGAEFTKDAVLALIQRTIFEPYVKIGLENFNTYITSNKNWFLLFPIMREENLVPNNKTTILKLQIFTLVQKNTQHLSLSAHLH